MQLTNGQLILRPVQLSDAYALFCLIDASRDTLRQYLPWVDTIYTPEDESKSLANMSPEIQNGKTLMLAITLEEQIIGLIDLHEISRNHQKAQIGYFLGDEFCGHGYMSQALNLLEEYAFTTLKLHRLEILIDENNLKSQAVAKRAHYQLEGCLRDYLYERKQFKNMLLFSKLAH